MLRLFLGFSISLFYTRWRGLIFFLFFLIFLLILSRRENYINRVRFFFEKDYISQRIIILSFWVVILCIISSQKIINYKNRLNKFIFLIVVLLFFLLLSFSLNNFLLFYVRFECSIIPVLLLILGWGYQPERIQAGLYLVFYTIFASLPLLLLILVNNKMNGSFIYNSDFYLGKINGVRNLFIVGAFLVKFPIYMTHLWLPKAHVEAPVSGSIILAGVLLKLGGYGIIRFLRLRGVFPYFLQSFLVFFRLWGGFVLRVNCLGQRDIKSLIACSSVVHMRTCIRGLLVLNEWGKQGCVLIILAHGLCSSGLFFLVGIIYNLTNRRRLIVNKGLINLIPSISLWWFLLLACNIACPPTINLLAEIEIISGLLAWSYIIWPSLALLAFFRCAYRIYLFSLSQHGKFFFSKQGFHSGFILDYLVVFLHWAPLNLFIFFVAFLIYPVSLLKILFCGDKDVLLHRVF